MKVRILLFARYAELAGRDELEIEVPPPLTVGDVWRWVGDRFPDLGRLADRPLMACDRAYAQADRPLKGGEEVAFFPPVGGG
jgi:molybdopterin converting factor small subunit